MSRPKGAGVYVLPDAWEECLQNWLAWLGLGGASLSTIRLRREHMRSMARSLDVEHPGDVKFSDLVTLCSGRQWSNEYRRSVRSSLISFFDWCVDNAVTQENPAIRMPTVRGDSPNPRPAPDEVWEHLLGCAAPRELLMIRLAGEAGMRREEIAKCHRHDLIADPRGDSLIVHGKGGKQRVVPIREDLARAIREFCLQGYLFPGATGGHISPKWVGTLISEMMPPGWTIHTLRHRFATRVYRGSRNLRAVQVLLGHATVATTERYTAVATDEVRAAMMSAGDG